MIARKTNSRQALTGTEVPGSGNQTNPIYSAMTMAELIAHYRSLAEKTGTSPATDFPSLLAGIHACQKLEKSLAPQAPKGEKETTVAKRAKKTTAKKQTNGAAPDGRSAVCQDFGARAGTNRAKAIDAAFEAGAKGIVRSGLLKKVYGSANVENSGGLDMVWKGVPDMIAKNRLGSKYEADRTGKGEETTYVLKKK